MKKLAIRSKVTYSKEYKKRVQNPNRIGIIIRQPKDQNISVVLWNGNIKGQYISKSFIEILK